MRKYAILAHALEYTMALNMDQEEDKSRFVEGLTDAPFLRRRKKQDFLFEMEKQHAGNGTFTKHIKKIHQIHFASFVNLFKFLFLPSSRKFQLRYESFCWQRIERAGY